MQLRDVLRQLFNVDLLAAIGADDRPGSDRVPSHDVPFERDPSCDGFYFSRSKLLVRTGGRRRSAVTEDFAGILELGMPSTSGGDLLPSESDLYAVVTAARIIESIEDVAAGEMVLEAVVLDEPRTYALPNPGPVGQKYLLPDGSGGAALVCISDWGKEVGGEVLPVGILRINKVQVVGL